MKGATDLYQQMYEHTLPKCQQCRVPMSCCSSEYCEIAIGNASEQGISLTRTGHNSLPMMGKNGCIVSPHLRPLCTLHVCSINSMGYDLKDPEWTDRYFELRDEIAAIDP